MSLIERILDHLFKFREIPNCEKQVYLKRWYILRTKKLGVFVHKFVRSDEDRALHDHPWNFLVIPIWRGYIEHHEANCGWCRELTSQCQCGEWEGQIHETQTRVRPILNTRLRLATYKHRVQLLTCPLCLHALMLTRKGALETCPKCQGRGEVPAWSIFIRFTKFREWGFYLPTGWIPWTKWWSEKCE